MAEADELPVALERREAARAPARHLLEEDALDRIARAELEDAVERLEAHLGAVLRGGPPAAAVVARSAEEA